MAADQWYRRYPRDWFEGTRVLTPEARGIYADIIDLLHIHDGRLPYDEIELKAKLVIREVRTLRRIFDELVRWGKLAIVDGMITNDRVIADLKKRGGRPFTKGSAWSRRAVGEELPTSRPSPRQLPPDTSATPESEIANSNGLGRNPPATESESESEEKIKKEAADDAPARARASHMAKFALVYAWLEGRLGLSAFNGSAIHVWLNAGADLDLHIKPAVDLVLAKMNGHGPPRSINYFTPAISEYFAHATGRMPEPRPGGNDHAPPSFVKAAMEVLDAMENKK